MSFIKTQELIDLLARYGQEWKALNYAERNSWKLGSNLTIETEITEVYRNSTNYKLKKDGVTHLKNKSDDSIVLTFNHQFRSYGSVVWAWIKKSEGLQFDDELHYLDFEFMDKRDGKTVHVYYPESFGGGTPDIVYDFVFTEELKNHIPNTTVYINDVIANVNDGYNLPYEVKIVANEGYYIDGVQGGGYDPIEDVLAPYFNLSEDGKTANASFNNSNFSTSYNFTIKERVIVPEPEPEPEPDVIINSGFINNLAENNMQAKINDTVIKSGDEFNYPFTMVIVPSVDNVIVVSGRGDFDPIADKYQQFVVSDDGLSMTYTFTDDDTFSNSGWIFVSDVVISDVRGFNDVYLLTDDQVREIIDKSYGTFTGGGLNQPSTYNDYREFILGLIDLPFNVPDELKLPSSFVKLGDLETHVKATVLDTDQLTIDMGSITYNVNDGNSYDFMGVSCKLHLPFSEPLAIEPHYIVNQTIRIEYVVNLIDGSAFINVYSDKINDVIISHQIDLYCEIPFRIQETNPLNNSPNSITYGNKNGVLTPYIEVLKNKTVLPYGFFTVPIVDETTINEVTGYVEIENINLQGNIPKDDQQNLLNLLRQGVINNVI